MTNQVEQWRQRKREKTAQELKLQYFRTIEKVCSTLVHAIYKKQNSFLVLTFLTITIYFQNTKNEWSFVSALPKIAY